MKLYLGGAKRGVRGILERWLAWVLKRPVYGRLEDGYGDVVAEATGDTRHGITFGPFAESVFVCHLTLLDGNGDPLTSRHIPLFDPRELNSGDSYYVPLRDNDLRLRLPA